MKLLVIGLDGLSYGTFMEHDMPYLKSHAENGACVVLESLEGEFMCTGPVWTSIQTGVRPEQHGVMGTVASNWYASALKPGIKTIWRRLNERQLSCGLVNFPVTYPTKPVDRFVVAGFPAPWSDEGVVHPWEYPEKSVPLFWPEDIADAVESFRGAWMNYIPRGAFENSHVPYRQAKSGDREALLYFMGLLYRSLHETAGIAHRLHRRFEVDLLATVFMETDSLGHLGIALGPEHRTAFLRVTDEVVGRLCEAAGADNVIVLSDHGCWGDSHTRDGVLLAWGRAFDKVTQARLSVMKIAPTILYVLGVYAADLPEEPAYEILAGRRMAEADKEQVEERLRAMGYI